MGNAISDKEQSMNTRNNKAEGVHIHAGEGNSSRNIAMIGVCMIDPQTLTVSRSTVRTGSVPMVECDSAEKSFAIHHVADLCRADGDMRRA